MAFATSMFAYYSYSSPGDEIGQAIIGWTTIIATVFNIILFFRILDMAKDVRELNNKFCRDEVGYTFKLNKVVMKLKYTGRGEEAKDILDKNLESEVFETLTLGTSPEVLQRKVERVINKYEKYYNCLNCEMPDEMKNIDVAKILDEYSSLCRTV